MAGGKGFRIEGLEELRKLNEGLAREVEAYRKRIGLEMWRALSILEAEIIAKILASGLQRRTGHLLNSIGPSKSVRFEGSQVIGTIGPVGVVYAATHEFGAVITPKRRQWLTIPLDAAKSSAGIPRLSAPEAINQGAFFVMSRRGNLLIAKARRGGGITPLFALKKMVKIPARPYLRPALLSKQAEIMEKFGLLITMTTPEG